MGPDLDLDSPEPQTSEISGTEIASFPRSALVHEIFPAPGIAPADLASGVPSALGPRVPVPGLAFPVVGAALGAGLGLGAPSQPSGPVIAPLRPTTPPSVVYPMASVSSPGLAYGPAFPVGDRFAVSASSTQAFLIATVPARIIAPTGEPFRPLAWSTDSGQTQPDAVNPAEPGPVPGPPDWFSGSVSSADQYPLPPSFPPVNPIPQDFDTPEPSTLLLVASGLVAALAYTLLVRGRGFRLP